MKTPICCIVHFKFRDQGVGWAQVSFHIGQIPLTYHMYGLVQVYSTQLIQFVRTNSVCSENFTISAKCHCYNFSYPELLLFHIDSSPRSNRLRLIPYDILTPSSVSFTALYCGAQSARSPFRLFFS